MFRLELLKGGGLPSAKFIDIKQMEKPANLPIFGTSNIATRMRRIRYLNKTIIGLEEIWLDLDEGKVKKNQVSDSLYHYYRTRLGKPIEYSKTWFDTNAAQYVQRLK